MRTPTVVAVAALVSAGCLGLGADELEPATTGDGAPLTALEAARGAVPLNATGTMGDWFTLAHASGPAGHVVAAVWTAPDGAVVPSAFFDRTDTVVLEVAPMLPAEAEVVEWALLAFQLGHEAEPISMTTGAELQWTNRFAATKQQGVDGPPLDPFTFYLGLSLIHI